MNLNEFGKELLGCIQLDELKASELLVEKIILATLKKVVEDTANPFDNQAFELVAPLVGPKAKEVVADLFKQLGV